MATCGFCEKDLLLGHRDDTKNHIECYDARDKRYTAGMCTKCGKDPIVPDKKWFCEKCNQSSKYRNYLGPNIK